MNKQRRKDIDKLIEELEALKGRAEDIQSEEQEYVDNMPENLQQSERAEQAEAAAAALEAAVDSIDEAVTSLQEASE